jgi:hypothetical protein
MTAIFISKQEVHEIIEAVEDGYGYARDIRNIYKRGSETYEILNKRVKRYERLLKDIKRRVRK